MVLGEENAEGLEEICEGYQDVAAVADNKLDALVEINLYLAEMYRINGQKTEYEKKISLLETLVSRAMCHKNELLIEKIKYKIEYFEYEAAKKLVEEVEESGFEYKVKKAGFYKQLSEYELADRILSKCSAELAQMKIPKDIYASYLEYLNLCHRAGRWSIADEYSDAEYLENQIGRAHV